ncbi:ribulose-phosphate 3-epimerase [Pseudoglutamicibacter albus]|uniref:ribulose-phosphate 3-epimerase n=1 Tax=Pseudoglutamicibacter TaxID=1742991 RepID=UPI000C766638|nr:MULTISPECIES: ribulose-phosphate 3-epimerase [Pseudoglutamicibacter]MCT1687031.1 ribulose-phosphate 3-epimerase [Pseudoglutamicibacter cumminsii]MDK7082868.1 ribulose-phosphate 3-epimerase [Pseudoglutamicibacter cumminsii]PKY80501.1 ribulose-phosphate 3-epimerase [Pseudoglutamicibacter albus]WIK84589.1 ribulose-phosphate 3-epimerase [Pseudoglutamicibacter albus]
MSRHTCVIHPSILSADFLRLGEELQAIKTADAVHVDVMDQHFVPNLTFGPPVVKRIQDESPLPLDIHLMIEDPDRWAPEYADMGAYSVTFHAEAATAPIRLARELRARGSKASMALRPATGLDSYMDMLPELDMLLLMTVEPGFGGQAFLDVVVPKIRAARKAIDGSGAQVALQVDGGVTTETIRIAAEAGADTFVAGSSVYGAEDVAVAIENLRREARDAIGH